MAKLTMHAEFFDALAVRLQKLEDGIDGPVSLACVEAGAAVLADAMKKAAPVRSGRLRESIVTTAPTRKDGGAVCYVDFRGQHHRTKGHVTRNAEVAFIHNYGRRASSGGGKRGRRGVIGGQQASGWVINTSEQQSRAVQDAMEQKFNELTREVFKP